MLTGRAAELVAALRQTFPRWDYTLDGDNVAFTYGSTESAFRPSKRTPTWTDLITTLTNACAAGGITRGRLLPLHGLDGADLTFSAVQALDPYLKHRQRQVPTHGFIPQPVIRFTGQRDTNGALLPGYATSFVNTSIVEPIDCIRTHASLIDIWIGVLSRLGFHTRHIRISGNLAVWQRAPVAGITLRFHHEGRELGDAVLLWNTDDPSKLATDIGSGLERLAWLLTRHTWANVICGSGADRAGIPGVDALRTATLIVGAGIRPASRGPGSSVRRLLHHEAGNMGACGVSNIVRWAHAFWSEIEPLPVPWHEVCRIIDSEVFDQPAGAP